MPETRKEIIRRVSGAAGPRGTATPEGQQNAIEALCVVTAATYASAHNIPFEAVEGLSNAILDALHAWREGAAGRN